MVGMAAEACRGRAKLPVCCRSRRRRRRCSDDRPLHSVASADSRAGLPGAFVGQDGLTLELAEPLWDRFDVFFIGGSTEWKLGPVARELAAEAKARGKHVHMGRVNSGKRVAYARLIGCDSVDGTFLKFAPTENLGRLRKWFE